MLGYIKLHRQITDNKYWFSERFTKSQAWIDLLLLANHKPATFFIRGNEVNLERGQLGYAITTLAKRWKWNERTVDKFLSALQKDQMIHYRKSHITTIITIKNYDLYQDNTEQNTEQSKNRIQTNNNDKNEKNDKEYRTKLFAEKVYKNNGYPKEDLSAFIEYWTESGENQKRLRFEFEKTFDISRRIKRWIRNKEERMGKKSEAHLDDF
jgi:DNA replication protein DnaD